MALKTLKKQFFDAARQGNPALLEECLSKDPSLGREAMEWQTALSLVAQGVGAQAAQCVQTLLAHSDVSVRAPYQGATHTPLMMAASVGNAQSVRLLIEAGSPTRVQDEWGRNALMIAAQARRAHCVEALVLTTPVEDQDKDGWTALMYAANSNDQASVQQLLKSKQGHSLQLVGRAIEVAAEGMRVECFEGLLDFAVHQSIAIDPQRILTVILMQGDLEDQPSKRQRAVRIMQKTLSVGAQKRQAPQQSFYLPLTMAARNGYVEILPELLRLADAKQVDDAGRSPLFVAAENGYAACVRELLKHSQVDGADVNGFTALIVASARGRVDCVRLLAEVSDVDRTEACGLSALALALKNGHLDCVDVLATCRGIERAKVWRAMIPAHLELPLTQAWIEHQELATLLDQPRAPAQALNSPRGKAQRAFDGPLESPLQGQDLDQHTNGPNDFAERMGPRGRATVQDVEEGLVQQERSMQKNKEGHPPKLSRRL